MGMDRTQAQTQVLGSNGARNARITRHSFSRSRSNSSKRRRGRLCGDGNTAVRQEWSKLRSAPSERCRGAGVAPLSFDLARHESREGADLPVAHDCPGARINRRKRLTSIQRRQAVAHARTLRHRDAIVTSLTGPSRCAGRFATRRLPERQQGRLCFQLFRPGCHDRFKSVET